MILIDFSQICISNIMQNHAAIGANRSERDEHVEEDMVRHMVLNSLRYFNMKFKEKYGIMVLCLDSKKNWRKEIFPYYKASRAGGRAKSVVDWKVIFHIIDTLRDELKDNMPYKVLQVEHAEADDIIGSLCYQYGCTGLVPASAAKIMIVSGDKDFAQLQKFANVEQYSPVQKRFIVEPNPKGFLSEHICRGDRADGVPNFLSPDHSFVDADARQTPLKNKYLQKFLANDPLVFESDAQEQQYQRNKKCIDLSHIPLNIREQVVEQFLTTVPAERAKIMNYFIKHRLRELIGALGEF